MAQLDGKVFGLGAAARRAGHGVILTQNTAPTQPPPIAPRKERGTKSGEELSALRNSLAPSPKFDVPQPHLGDAHSHDFGEGRVGVKTPHVPFAQ